MNPLDSNKVPNEELQANDAAPATETNSQATETSTESTEQTNLNLLSLAELVDSLREHIGNAEKENLKAKVELIKQVFYKKLKAEKDAQAAEAAEKETEQQEDKSESVYETELKALLNDYKEIKAKQLAAAEAEKERNLQARQEIIDAIKKFIDSPDTVHEHVTEFRQLQQDWREAGSVPQANANALFKSYNSLVENYYDLLKMNNELRDYDFKKNLELKTALCESAEKLNEETDVISAFHSLQNLHSEWAHIGPVSKELREALWARFKDASTIINKKHQAHFEEIKKIEEHNLHHKTGLCEMLEAIDYEGLRTFKDWDKITEDVLKLQQDWKSIGYASRKMNVEIFERYRKACDDFFSKKSEFYKEVKEEQAQNLEKKKALVAKAEALKDSTDWKNATKSLIDIQKEWKTIGTVPRKNSDAVWKEFIAACDYFFEQKDKAFASQKTEEKDNLAKKIEIIERIEGFHLVEDLAKDVEELKKIIGEFNAVGHVPFKEKDKIYKRFREACDKQFDTLNIDAHNRHIDAFTVSVESMAGRDKNHLFREREKLRKQHERLKSEILTCENNMGFFTSNSKKPNPLLVEMERRIEKLKIDNELLLKKIQLIEAQLG